jgi:hypothetical protein
MNGDLTEVLYALFVTPRNLIIIGMAWALVLLLGKIIPNGWVKGYKAHFVPLLDLAICSGAVWAPGLRPGLPPGSKELAGLDGHEIGFRIGLGVLLALSAYVVPAFMMWFAEKKLPPGVVKQLRKML